MTLPAIPAALRDLVLARARQRCEYCLVHQDVSIYSHEVDHIIALKHGGQTREDNLATACLPCNRSKGSDLACPPTSPTLFYLRDTFLATAASTLFASVWIKSNSLPLGAIKMSK